MAQKLPAFNECLAELIRIPSVSSVEPELDMSNRPVASLLGNWLEDLGFEVELAAVAGTGGKVNVIARRGRGEGGLVLSGHTDTVPWDEGRWSQDPFRLVERDRRYYGLGTADMKSFFAFVVDALRDLDAGALRRPLTVLATCDEETGMAGARALVAAGQRLGRYAVIGEPTGLRPVNVHKGTLMESIRVVGRSGHASDPALGNSALEGMRAVMDGLAAWRSEIQATQRDDRFAVPVPTLNFGVIHGGDNPNRICAACELKIDIRVLPGMDMELTRSGARQAAMRAVDGSGLVIEFDALMEGAPPLETPETSEIVRTAERLSGLGAGTVGFGTEGPFLNALGMDTVILGAGDIEQAHRPDEYLGLERIEPMRRMLSGLIHHFCMRETGDAT